MMAGIPILQASFISQGEGGQQGSEMTPEYVNSVSERYIELYEKITKDKFEKAPDSEDLLKRIENNVMNYLKLKI